MNNIEKVFKAKGDVSELEVLEKTDDLAYMEMYFRVKMPMFMSDRDGLVAINRYPVEGNKMLYCMRSIENPKKPLIDGVLRM